MMSCLGMAEARNSIEQQASPNWNIHSEYFRLQLSKNDTDLGSLTRWTRSRPSPSIVTLQPLKSLLAPGIRQPKGKNADEDDHLDEGAGAELVEDHCPGEKEHRLDVEDDEEQAEEVVPDLGLGPAAAHRIDAALVGEVLLRTADLGADQLVQPEGACDEEEHHGREEGQSQILAKVSLRHRVRHPSSPLVCNVPHDGHGSRHRKIRPVVGSSGVSDLPPRNAADQGFDWEVSSDVRAALDDSYFKLPEKIAIITWGALAWDPGELPLVSDDPEHPEQARQPGGPELSIEFSRVAG